MKMLYVILCFSLMGTFSCGDNDLHFEEGDLKISVEAGKNWLHDFPLFLGIKVKNPPQFAIWVTDPDTNYVGTLFCTHKIAREGWRMNHGNRRKEALPFWAHCRGIQEKDGLFLPTKEHPLTDAVSGATPKSGYTLRFQPGTGRRFLIFAEFNHSTDFNTAYPESAQAGERAYSGGKEGSGQPALVYCTAIDPEAPYGEWTLQLIGHSSPDGSDGKLYPDMQGIDTALEIVKRIVITRK